MGRANRGRGRPVRCRTIPEGVRGKARSPTGLHGDGPGHRGDLPGLPRPDRATWAGSPAASLRIGPRPSALSSSPNSSAASTPPPPSWGLPGRRCAKPSPATASACPPATLKPSASGPSLPPTSAPASRPPQAWTRCLWRSTPMRSRLESGHRLSCMSGSAARSSTPSWAPMWWSSFTARATPAGQPPGPGRSSGGPTAVTGWPASAGVRNGRCPPPDLAQPVGVRCYRNRSPGWRPLDECRHRR
jgi:hypothetical protein